MKKKRQAKVRKIESMKPCIQQKIIGPKECKQTRLKIKVYVLALITVLAMHPTNSYASKDVAAETLYFDMGMEGGWVPFHTGAETGRKGLLIDLANALQAETGIQFTAVHFPPKRAEKALLDGIVDFDFVCLEWLKENKPGEKFVATDPFFEITEHLVTLKQNKDLFPTRESMFGKRVGTIAGYFYFDDNEFIRTDFSNENSVMLGLKNDRFKVAILERETAKYWASRNEVNIAFSALHTSGKLVMRLRIEHAQLLPLLNQSIKTLKDSGVLQVILDNHGLESKIY